MSEPYDPNKPPQPGPPQYGQQPQYGQPPQYGQQPQYGQPQYGQPPGGAFYPPTPTYNYASWGSRVAAYLLDGWVVALPGTALIIIGYIMLFSSLETTSDEYGYTTTADFNAGAIAVVLVGVLISIAISVWNVGYRQGTTGQSLGKKWMGISVVSEPSGQPLGFGMSIVRWVLSSALGGACFLNYLWPLWDAKKQCWHDMIIKSVVIKAR